MSAPGCMIKPKRTKGFTTKVQLKIIDKFLLKHPKLSCRQWQKRLNKYERREVNKLWEILTLQLNARGPEKNVIGWKQVLMRHQQKGILNPTQQQFKIIDEFLLDHPKIPYRPFPKTLNGYERTEVPKLWLILRQLLNSHGPPERDVKGWKEVWLRRRRQQNRCAKNIEALHKTSCAAIQPALPIRIEPAESNEKSCSNDDSVLGIIEPDVVPETSQNDKTMSTISQDLPRLRKRLPRLKPSKRQSELLDEYALKHPDRHYFWKQKDYHWQMLKYRLNKCGPERTSKEWRILWKMRKELAQSMETHQGTTCSAALQPALQIRIEPGEFNVKSCSNDDGVFGIIEPDLGPQTSQNDKNIAITSTISQDELHIKSELALENGHEFGNENAHEDSHELDEECVHEDSHELDEENVYEDSHELDEDCAHEDSHELDEENVYEDSHDMDEENVHEDSFELDEGNVHEDSHELDEDCVHEDSHELDEENVGKDSHELDEENVHEDSHELDEENNVYEDFHPTNSDEFQTQPQREQQCQKCHCCCSSQTRSNELFEKHFEMQTKFMQNLTEQREHFHIEILKILEENNKLLKESLRKKKEENDVREVKAEELRLKKIELKIMKAINDVKLKKLNL